VVSDSTVHHKAEVYDAVHGGVLVYGRSTLEHCQQPSYGTPSGVL
jgi:hypothetical protein